jgi:omega-6 fatty acid desaturase (delta-12 desaturase)
MAPVGTPRPADLVHLKPSNGAGILALAATAAATVAGVALAARGAWLPWITGQLLLASAFVQWFVILHECGHDTLFRTRTWNRITGNVAGFFALIPFASWTRVHARHHRWTGWQDLDPTTETLVPRNRGRVERAVVNLCWKYWLPLFALTYRALNYWNLPRLRAMFPRASARRAITRDIGVLLSGYAGLAVLVGPLELIQLAGPAIVLSFIVEDVLLLSQHTHIPQQVSGGTTVKPFAAMDQEAFTRSLRLPAPASTLLLHFDAHELHHMYPYVPGYLLRRIPYRTGGEIGWWDWTRRARRVPGEVFLFQNRNESGFDV